ncbi:MAG: DUF362 domain-containing protein [Spirochaetia bacterium]|nr:DUF362 domain-containing protein [Spirochaetia bacterium]
MPGEVYFTRFGAPGNDDSILNRLAKMFDRVGAGAIIKQNENVAVKAHFGEQGNVSFVSPLYYRTIVDRIKACGGNPFLTDTNTLYVGERNNAVKHLNTALRHGFAYATAGAPVMIADGLSGMDAVEVQINGDHVKKAKVASAIYWANAMIVVSHCKGHMMTAMGGAIKNLGMGCAARAGKQDQHSGNVPKFRTDNCTGCEECVAWCNFGALKIVDGRVINDPSKCAGCGECIPACRFDAIDSNWDTDLVRMNEKMAEYAAAAMNNKKNKAVFFNFVLNVTPECDCMPSSDNYLVPDIGILASFDPVAIDKASVDLVNKASVIRENVEGKEGFDLQYAEKDKFRIAHPKLDWSVQLKHAEKMGLGSMDYEIIEV